MFGPGMSAFGAPILGQRLVRPSDRLVRIDTPSSAPGVGLCLDAHDLAIAKYVAGRMKDLEFTAQLAHHGLTRRATLLDRLAATKIPSARRRLVEQRIASHFRTSRP